MSAFGRSFAAPAFRAVQSPRALESGDAQGIAATSTHAFHAQGPRMKLSRIVLVLLATVTNAGWAVADDSGNFVVKLGQDTTSVEHYNRSASRLEVNQVGRAPRVLRRHFVYDFANGALSRLSMVVTPPGSTTPTQTIEITVGTDSTRVQVQSGSAPAQTSAYALPPGTLIVASSSPWAPYEGQLMKFVRGKADSALSTMYFLGASGTSWLRLSKLGRDSVVIVNQHDDVFHVRVDKDGRVLGVLPISGTGKFSVARVPSLDVDAMAASFAAREQAGVGLGPLSPRDTVRVANAGGASLMIDYGRPSRRGRAIFGNVVPYGQVWRTGANAATQFRTDKALDFGGTVVPAGFYTLWTIPTATGWKLVVNSETGQWGTEHKADKDLYTVDMKTSPLTPALERFTITVDGNAQGGTLNMDWDATRASVPFVVKP